MKKLILIAGLLIIGCASIQEIEITDWKTTSAVFCGLQEMTYYTHVYEEMVQEWKSGRQKIPEGCTELGFCRNKHAEIFNNDISDINKLARTNGQRDFINYEAFKFQTSIKTNGFRVLGFKFEYLQNSGDWKFYPKLESIKTGSAYQWQSKGMLDSTNYYSVNRETLILSRVRKITTVFDNRWTQRPTRDMTYMCRVTDEKELDAAITRFKQRKGELSGEELMEIFKKTQEEQEKKNKI